MIKIIFCWNEHSKKFKQIYINSFHYFNIPWIRRTFQHQVLSLWCSRKTYLRQNATDHRRRSTTYILEVFNSTFWRYFLNTWCFNDIWAQLSSVDNMHKNSPYSVNSLTWLLRVSDSKVLLQTHAYLYIYYCIRTQQKL